MPTPINQLLNDESIAVQIIFFNEMSHVFDGLIGDGSEFQVHFVIFLDTFSKTMWWRLFIKCIICTYIYVALIIIIINGIDVGARRERTCVCML